jgi:hypothetical protein
MAKKLRLDSKQIEVMDDAMAEVLKKKTPAERLALGNSLRSMARTILRGHLKRAHPDWDSKTLDRAVAHRLLHGTS